MYKKLKECKTLKEIFTIIGTKPFERVAFIIVILWCLLPIYWAGERVYWTLNATNKLQHGYAIQSGAQYSVFVLGSISLYVAIFFLISRLSVYGKKIWNKIKEEPWHFLLLIMLFWACISTLLASDRTLAWEGDSYLAEGLRTYFFYAGVYVCTFIITNKRHKWIILNIFNIIAIFVASIVIVQDTYFYPFINDCFPGMLASVFFHFNHCGYYMCMGIACAIGLYLYEERRWIRYFYAFSIAFQIYGILVNSCFGSFLGDWCALVMILVFFVIKKGKWSWRMLTPIIITIVLIIISYMGYIPNSTGQDMKTNFEMLFSDGSAIVTNSEKAAKAGHGRMKLWKQSLKMIPKKPIFGYGPSILDAELAKTMKVGRPDNEFIQHAVFMGVPALLFYLSSLIGLFIHQCKKIKQLDRCTLIAAGCMIAYLVSAMFGVSAFYTTPYLYMFWGMAAGRPQSEENESVIEENSATIEE